MMGISSLLEEIELLLDVDSMEVQILTLKIL